MSPRLPRVTAAEVLRALHRDGWQDSRQSGSHLILRHQTKPGSVVVPKHASRTIGPGLLAKICEDASLTVEELRGLL
jgi:predicted RNA binding protein YcfA (HicA-like mRNA interferase family)